MSDDNANIFKEEIPAKGFLCFLPWLRLPGNIEFNGFKFIRYPNVDETVPKIHFLKRMFGSYRDSYGNAVPDVTLVP